MIAPLTLATLEGEWAIARLPAGAPVPDWAWSDLFSSVSRTSEELSIIAPEPGPVRSSSGAVMMADPIPRQPKYDTLIIAGKYQVRPPFPFDPPLTLDGRRSAEIASAASSVARIRRRSTMLRSWRILPGQ